jgi:hypothetical protein
MCIHFSFSLHIVSWQSGHKRSTVFWEVGKFNSGNNKQDHLVTWRSFYRTKVYLFCLIVSFIILLQEGRGMERGKQLNKLLQQWFCKCSPPWISNLCTTRSLLEKKALAHFRPPESESLRISPAIYILPNPLDDSNVHSSLRITVLK